MIGEYTGANNKVLIRCNKCGHEWNAIPRAVKASKYGCPKCGLLEGRRNTAKEKFIKNLGSNYELIKYIDFSNVTVKCKKCGYIRHTTADNILRFGCKRCSSIEANKDRKLSNLDFIERANTIHNFKYDYSKVEYYNWNTPIIITCPIHGDFAQMPGKHLQGQGCPKCQQSSGEQIINTVLKSFKIDFDTEVVIKNPYHNHNFRVDFYIELNSNKYIIEYNGEQHYKPVEYFGGTLKYEEQKQRDKDLELYCMNNNTNLLSIRFDEMNIKDKIREFLKLPLD